ncbi:15110_t:CDS:2, partial [Gigaspora rosea]
LHFKSQVNGNYLQVIQESSQWWLSTRMSLHIVLASMSTNQLSEEDKTAQENKQQILFSFIKKESIKGTMNQGHFGSNMIKAAEVLFLSSFRQPFLRQPILPTV